MHRFHVLITAGAAALEASEPRRQISGLIVPWGITATVRSGQRVRFERDSILLPANLHHVAFIDDHDPSEPTGHLASAESQHNGLHATYQLGTGPRADAALRDALELVRTGLSIGADPADPARPPYQEADGTLVFTADRPAILRETSLLSLPAYSEARVSAVAASQPTQENPAMSMVPPAQAAPAPQPAATPAPAPATVAAAAPPAPAPAPAPVETPTAAAAIPPATQAGTPAVTVGLEPFPYTFSGFGPSMLKDYVDSRDGNREATDRLGRAARMLEATPTAAVLAGENPAIAASMGGASIQAAPGSTTVDVSDLAQTMHRPDLWLPLIERMTPIYNACTKVPIDRPNPFLYPATVAYAGVPDATPAEGVNPTAGTITTDPITVTPALVHGSYEFSRTLLDSAAPGIDVVAGQAIREAIARDLEAKGATALQATTDTVTAATDGQVYLLGLREQLAAFINTRYTIPTHLLASATDYALAIMADDTTDRPLIPPTAAQNAVGAAGQAAGSLDFYNLEGGLAPAWALTTKHTVLLNKSDVQVFATPIQSFRFEEKQGPELIEVAFRMYVVFHIRRAVGVMDLVHP